MGVGFVVLIWGLNFTVVKTALREVPPFWFNALRFTLAFGALWGGWVLGAPKPLEGLRASGERALGPLFGLGLIGHGLYQVCFIVGLARSTAGSAAIVLSGTPLWTALLAHLFGQERLRLRSLLGMLLAFSGVVLVVIFGGRQVSLGADALWGNLLIVGASCCWAAYTVLSRPLVRRIGPLEVTLWSMAPALPLLWSLVALEPMPRWERLSVWAWLGLLYSGLLAIALSYVLWAHSIRRIGAARTAVYGNLVPVIAASAGVILLQEPLHVYQMVGGLVVLVGVYLVQRRL
ncbi:MAG: DMT family transporter [Bacteroidota bacterium]|nr:DMT family transporter [Rhodothermia bacterium]MCS7155620.1 DMT family transporter [Bacteroidota bacterium]MDW8137240.1 DMT family transporter [Bacteroidota bacterium]MDW8284890.1 DMT family transporter [Bacteroidota bacterium]